MPSGLKRTKRISPMPVVSSFPAPNREVCYSECTTRQMTEEERIKYGPPLMPLKHNKNHYLSGKKGVKKGA